MLTSKQRGYLSGLASQAEPTVMVGKEGSSEGLYRMVAQEFRHRELLKIRFVASKDERNEIAHALAEQTGAELVRVIGNVAVLYRPAEKSEDRTIQLP
jgi:RNA-binding protein